MYAVALLADFLQHQYVCWILPYATVVPRSGDLQRAEQASATSFPASTHGEAQSNLAIWAEPATIQQVVLVFRAAAFARQQQDQIIGNAWRQVQAPLL